MPCGDSQERKTSLTIKVDVHIKDTYNTRVCEGEYIMVRTDSRGTHIPNAETDE